MPRSVSAVFDWTMIAAAVGLLLVILLSPSGSFVRSPMEGPGQAGGVAAPAVPATGVEPLAARD